MLKAALRDHCERGFWLINFGISKQSPNCFLNWKILHSNVANITCNLAFFSWNLPKILGIFAILRCNEPSYMKVGRSPYINEYAAKTARLSLCTTRNNNHNPLIRYKIQSLQILSFRILTEDSHIQIKPRSASNRVLNVQWVTKSIGKYKFFLRNSVRVMSYRANL